MSNVLKHFPPDKDVNRSSIFRMGYLSTLEAWFTVLLKSSQIRTLFLSPFSTGTIGAAQSASSTGSKYLVLLTGPTLYQPTLCKHMGLSKLYKIVG